MMDRNPDILEKVEPARAKHHMSRAKKIIAQRKLHLELKEVRLATAPGRLNCPDLSLL